MPINPYFIIPCFILRNFERIQGINYKKEEDMGKTMKVKNGT